MPSPGSAAPGAHTQCLSPCTQPPTRTPCCTPHPTPPHPTHLPTWPSAQDNLIHGRFLAELTKEVFTDLEASKYQHAEMRISIYGRKPVEWDILAAWVVANNLASNNVVWLIQIPRLYNVYRWAWS